MAHLLQRSLQSLISRRGSIVGGVFVAVAAGLFWAGQAGSTVASPSESAFLAEASWDPGDETPLGILLGRDHDVRLVAHGGRVRYDVYRLDGSCLGTDLTATELRRMVPAMTTPVGGASPLDRDPPDATLMRMSVPGNW